MKTNIRRMLAVLRGFLCPSRKCQTAGEFLPTKSDTDLGRKKLEKFIYW
jgi:hypothetical protein